ncbi:hypothetical protein ACFQVD_03375 [Streptosporangium amethystogenes subsp. fukuiense]|uniref:YCII-related domain-containing protein n=2 Tax=Streptosporangium amethystogenes TaxID=2002 RepID=A0ABW2ST08_9ACTN
MSVETPAFRCEEKVKVEVCQLHRRDRASMIWLMLDGQGAEKSRLTDHEGPGCTALAQGSILDLPSREAALEWAKKIAASCRCSQEVRAFQYDPLT